MTDAVIERVARAIAAANGTRLWVRAEGEAALSALEAGDEVGDGSKPLIVVDQIFDAAEMVFDAAEMDRAATEDMREACAQVIEEMHYLIDYRPEIAAAIRALKVPK